MSTDPKRSKLLQKALAALTTSQLDWVWAVIRQFEQPYEFYCNEASDVISPEVLARLGDALRIHHSFSRQPLSKDRFEFALESALNRSGIPAELVASRTSRGHDITIRGIRVSLKTQADSSIRPDLLHISKFMELGKGAWELPLLREMFLDHMKSYDRIFQFRCLISGPTTYLYELVEIPKSLLEEVRSGDLITQHKSRQSPQPGYGTVSDLEGRLKFALYFDGGTERKLQIRKIRKDLCFVHATWRFESMTIEESIPR